MHLHEMTFSEARPVDGYGPGFFRIDGKVLAGPLIVSADGVFNWGGLEDAEALLALKDSLDVIFVGTGDDIAHVPAALRSILEEAGLGVEPMSSPAACRTFNVLVSEGRRVAAALLPVTGTGSGQ